MKGIWKGVIVLTVLLSACDNGPDCTRVVQQSELDKVDADQLAVDNQLIDDYISTNSLGPVEEVNGIKYILTVQGNGVIPCLENSISFTYKGKFLSNGDTFDSSINPIEISLSNLILGWKLVFPTFQKGTKATLFIPSGYGYGPAGRGSIPPNANLIFDVELVGVR
ncbi:MAG: FKBP-type peptidyl-prolyl cis-trans isomerase [Cyclobacteriaceae bacterium]